MVSTEALRPNDEEWLKVFVLDKGDKGSYTVETLDASGVVYRRNRVQLKESQEILKILQDQELDVDKLN